MTKLTEITERSVWEDFTPLQQSALFLQSFDYRLLNERMGQSTWLYHLQDGKKIVRALVTQISAKRGTFLYLPYGPMLHGQDAHHLLASFFEQLKSKAIRLGASFIRVSPFLAENKIHQHWFHGLGFKPAPIHMLAETLWLKNLQDKSEAELLQEMDKKHRNLIRRALKEGVEIRKTNEKSSVDTFWSLYQQTFKRHNFTPYPKKLIQSQLELFSKHNSALMLEALYQGEFLASALVMYYGKYGAYHHGASSSDPKYRKIPSTYLLQWEAIKEAKSRGATHYNFWGIAPYGLDESGKRVYRHKNHPFNGITHFKTGFGGQRLDLLPCQDLIISWKYWLTYMIESVRKWKRGF